MTLTACRLLLKMGNTSEKVNWSLNDPWLYSLEDHCSLCWNAFLRYIKCVLRIFKDRFKKKNVFRVFLLDLPTTLAL